MMARILFVQPHPDDLELNCGQIMHYLVKKSPHQHTIFILSITKGEFGLPGPHYDLYKGQVLVKVRERELRNALAIHGIPASNLLFLRYIDGLVPFNREFCRQM